MKKIPSRKANIVATTINEMLDEWMPFSYTITSDNGKEFADHKRIAETLESPSNTIHGNGAQMKILTDSSGTTFLKK